MKQYKSFAEFYPFYLSEHTNVTCRRLHFFGAWLGIFCILTFVSQLNFAWLLGALVCGYGFSWIGHFFFEKNRPATFQYPLYSFMGDLAMFRDILIRKVKI